MVQVRHPRAMFEDVVTGDEMEVLVAGLCKHAMCCRDAAEGEHHDDRDADPGAPPRHERLAGEFSPDRAAHLKKPDTARDSKRTRLQPLHVAPAESTNLRALAASNPRNGGTPCVDLPSYPPSSLSLFPLPPSPITTDTAIIRTTDS